MRCAYDDAIGCARLPLRVPQEESGYGEEYAAYHPNREAERGASFGPAPVMVAVAADESQVGEACEGSGGERQSGPAPEIKCGGGVGSESEFTVSSEEGRREYVADQCPAQKSYLRGRKWGPIKVIRRGGRELSSGGCVVGAVTGAIIAEFGTAGLAPGAGAIGGCAVGAGSALMGAGSVVTRIGTIVIRLKRVIAMLTVLCASLWFASDVVGLSQTASVGFGIAVLAGTTAIIGRNVRSGSVSHVDRESIYSLPLSIRLLLSSAFCVVLVHYAAGAKWGVSIMVIASFAVVATLLDWGLRARRRV